jgi:hypothetical protein
MVNIPSTTLFFEWWWRDGVGGGRVMAYLLG